MSTIKLLSNLDLGDGIVAEGSVVDLPDAQAENLIRVGAAESTDDKVTEVVNTEAPKEAASSEEVATPADPLVATPADGEQTPPEQPAQPAPASSETPDNTSTNLHLA